MSYLVRSFSIKCPIIRVPSSITKKVRYLSQGTLSQFQGVKGFCIRLSRKVSSTVPGPNSAQQKAGPWSAARGKRGRDHQYWWVGDLGSDICGTPRPKTWLTSKRYCEAEIGLVCIWVQRGYITVLENLVRIGGCRHYVYQLSNLTALTLFNTRSSRATPTNHKFPCLFDFTNTVTVALAATSVHLGQRVTAIT